MLGKAVFLQNKSIVHPVKMAIVRSKWPDINIPENLTLTEFVYQNFDEYGYRTAIVSVFFLLLLLVLFLLS